MIVLDFDGVLVDDARFKKAYARAMQNLGISRPVFDTAYAATKKKHNGGFRYATHLAAIKHLSPRADARLLRRNLYALIARLPDFVYPEALSFLSNCRARGETLALLSGGCATQRRRVSASGLTRFFQTITVTEAPLKVQPMGALLRRFREDRTIFIDDKKKIIDAIKRRYPTVRAIHMLRRKGEEQSMHADAVLHNLAAARRFIRSLPGASR